MIMTEQEYSIFTHGGSHVILWVSQTPTGLNISTGMQESRRGGMFIENGYGNIIKPRRGGISSHGSNTRAIHATPTGFLNPYLWHLL